jgi:hypothetical protein
VTGEYRLADEILLPYDEAVSSRLGAVVPLVPAWSDPSSGLASIVVPDHEPSIADARVSFRYRVNEPVLLWSGYRNVSGETSCCGIATGRSNRTRAGTFAWSGQGREPWSRSPTRT